MVIINVMSHHITSPQSPASDISRLVASAPLSNKHRHLSNKHATHVLMGGFRTLQGHLWTLVYICYYLDCVGLFIFLSFPPCPYFLTVILYCYLNIEIACVC